NAVEASLKLARRATGRREVVAFSHGFHGMTLGSLAATANDTFRQWAGVPLTDVVRLPFETAPGGATGLAEYRAALADPSSGHTPPAAFIVEVIQAEGGVNVASREWLHEVQDLARDVGALFIIDEIQVGNGRTGSYFSFDGMGLDPDIINLAKGLGGFGIPIAMNLNKPEIDDHWSPGVHTGTPWPRSGLRRRLGRPGLRRRRGLPRLGPRQGRADARHARGHRRQAPRPRLAGARARHDPGVGHRRRGLRQARAAGILRPGPVDRSLRLRGAGDQADPAADHPGGGSECRTGPVRAGRRRGDEGRLMRRRDDMTFPPEEYERRLQELRERMVQRELDAVIITDPENLMYLTDHQTTGYSFFQALIVPLAADSVM